MDGARPTDAMKTQLGWTVLMMGFAEKISMAWIYVFRKKKIMNVVLSIMEVTLVVIVFAIIVLVTVALLASVSLIIILISRVDGHVSVRIAAKECIITEIILNAGTTNTFSIGSQLWRPSTVLQLFC